MRWRHPHFYCFSVVEARGGLDRAEQKGGIGMNVERKIVDLTSAVLELNKKVTRLEGELSALRKKVTYEKH